MTTSSYALLLKQCSYADIATQDGQSDTEQQESVADEPSADTADWQADGAAPDGVVVQWQFAEIAAGVELDMLVAAQVLSQLLLVGCVVFDSGVGGVGLYVGGIGVVAVEAVDTGLYGVAGIAFGYWVVAVGVVDYGLYIVFYIAVVAFVYYQLVDVGFVDSGLYVVFYIVGVVFEHQLVAVEVVDSELSVVFYIAGVAFVHQVVAVEVVGCVDLEFGISGCMQGLL